ncbi:MAG: YibE/F family protein [Arcanobacterium sp.]|nr:YibE/F family protein [Arcanobacterium sp.]
MHMHSHTSTLKLSKKDRARVVGLLAAIVVPLAIATLIGLIALWPRGNNPMGTLPSLAAGSREVVGTISSIGETDQYGQTPVTMQVDGVEVPVSVPFEIVKSGLGVGDEIRALASPTHPVGAAGAAGMGDARAAGTPGVGTSGADPTSGTSGANSISGTDASGAGAAANAAGANAAAGAPQAPAYIFLDFVRRVPMALLFAFYVLVVLAVARTKGLAALAGLGLSLVVLIIFMLPGLMMGKPALLVVLVGGAAMMFFSIYVAHGISIRTTTAVIGTFSGFLITTGLATWAISSMNLTGATSDASKMALTLLPHVSLPTILLCGMILAGLGALNDVTITQVSTVWELYAANPHASRRNIISRAMRVGRDHIASTVYTLAFAYMGTALPLLMVASLLDTGFTGVVLAADVSEEIVRTLVSSIGLVLAIPLTTVIAATLAPVAPGKDVPSSVSETELITQPMSDARI